MSDHLLLALVALPFVTALLVAVLPAMMRPLVKPLALGAMLLELGLTLRLFDGTYSVRGPAFAERYGWAYDSGIAWSFAVDGLSLPLLVMTAVLAPIALLASFPSAIERVKPWAAAVLVMQGALVGAFVARDLVLFYVFWELVLLPLYLVVATSGPGKSLTSNRFFLYTLAGSLVMLLAFAYTGAQFAAHAPRLSFALEDLERLVMPAEAQVACFLGVFLAFAIKIPLVPLHAWSPETYRDTPTGAAVLAAGAMAKLGSYGMLRIAMPLFPLGAQYAGATLAVFAVVAVLYGAVAAMRQDDMKMLIAYSSMSHMGFVVLGLLSQTSVGVAGATFQMMSHGLSTAALFLVADAVERRTGTRSIAALSGLASRTPDLARLVVGAALVAVAIPLTSGFVGETMILSGAFGSEGITGLGSFGPSFAAAAGLGVVLGAVYVLTLVQKVMFGPLNAATEGVTEDASRFETIGIGGLVLLSFLFGIKPSIFLESLQPAAYQHVNASTMRFQAQQGVRETTVVAPAPSAEADPHGGSHDDDDDDEDEDEDDAPRGGSRRPHAGEVTP